MKNLQTTGWLWRIYKLQADYEEFTNYRLIKKNLQTTGRLRRIYKLQAEYKEFTNYRLQ